ncbi:hypothetical protein [Streptomyces sp. CB01881]|uniref:hypothetical protein n=1 Tax=Streptomyces sp. CB01881 TaxID=2078691 RepID=UPI000CDBE521|nr:hypothetical protein [Streptomyces sp. CB01881]AUY53000.1 hypothetical protein C2142_33400 [Streptomyces sp. CB01881]TYC70715.1 hypothetical protein EH183_33460 [Streptomyces sp. CB01881]
MNTALKIAAFATGLTTAFGAAYGVGHATGTGPAPRPAAAAHTGHTGHAAEAPAGAEAAGDHLPGGLQVSERGYTLSLDSPFVTAGAPTDLRFRILGADGRPVTDYRPEHEKELHLIVAPRDLATFQHLHPTRAADGTWSAATALPAAGEYRVFADFTPAGAAEGLTLGTDLHAAGDLRPAPLPETGRSVAVDGYTVTLGGDLTPGRPARLTLTVTKDGRPVTDLQPYLGAYGHLVALRAGDLAYLHVHPESTTPGPEVAFTATAPSPGAYRLFLDFKHGDTVRTAAFTVATGDGAAPATAAPSTAAAPSTTAAPSTAPEGAHQH